MQKNLIESQIIFDLKQVESDYKVFRKLNKKLTLNYLYGAL